MARIEKWRVEFGKTMKYIKEKFLYDNRIEIFLFFVIVIVATFIFFWNLPNNGFFRSDEYYLTDLMNQNLITSIVNYKKTTIGLSSSMLTVIFLTKPFFFINSFPSFRYVTSFYSVVGILISYLTVRTITANYLKAFFASLLFSTQPYVISISRMFNVDALILLLTSLIIYFYFKWYRSKKIIYLIATFIFLAFAIYNHGSAIYLAIPLFLWFILILFKKKIKLSHLIISILIFSILMIPFLLLVCDAYRNNFSIAKDKYIRLGLKYYGLDPTINLFHINEYILPHILIFFNIDFNSFYYFAIFLFFILVSYLFIKKTDENKFLIFISIFAFLSVIFSPVPSVNTTHLLPFFILFIFSLFQSAGFKRRNILLIFLILFILISSFPHLSQISNNVYAELQSDISGANRLIIQGNQIALFKYLGYDKKYNLSYYQCSDLETSGIIGNETFDKLEQFSKGDIIIAMSSWCEYQTINPILLEKLEFIAGFPCSNIYKLK